MLVSTSRAPIYFTLSFIILRDRTLAVNNVLYMFLDRKTCGRVSFFISSFPTIPWGELKGGSYLFVIPEIYPVFADELSGIPNPCWASRNARLDAASSIAFPVAPGPVLVRLAGFFSCRAGLST